MTTIRRTIDVHAPSTRAWELIGPVANISTWHPAIASSATSDDDTRRTCVLADGARITEQVHSHSDRDMAYTYAITDGPLPVRDYVSTISVCEAEGGCQLSWEAEFTALAPEEEVVGMLTQVYDAGLQSAKAQLEA